MGDCDRAGLFAARSRSLPRSRHPGKQVEDRADIGADRGQASISCTRHARSRRRNRAICRGPNTPADLGTEYDRGAAYLSWLAASASYIALLPFVGFGEAQKIVFRRIRDRLKATLVLLIFIPSGKSTRAAPRKDSSCCRLRPQRTILPFQARTTPSGSCKLRSDRVTSNLLAAGADP